jgi:hypothetical protein
LTIYYDNANTESCQAKLGELLVRTPLATELDEIFNCVSYRELEEAILAKRTRAFNPLGRFGYPIPALLKAYLAGYILGVRSTNDLMRRLQEDPLLATVCGFDYRNPPCRRTFIRFWKKLVENKPLLDSCLNEITTKLGQSLPGFGTVTAMDATPVRSHSNPDNRKVVSDAKADWVYKEGNEKKKWVWGYRLHLLVDANYELPIAMQVTVADEGEKIIAMPLLHKAKSQLPSFHPKAVICDKGYDKGKIFESIVKEFDADPIIKLARKREHEPPEISGSSAAPCCPGGLPLIYRSWDKRKGLQYQCPEKARRAICPLAEKCPIKIIWIKPVHDYRRFGHRIKRGTDEFEKLYHKRVSVERVNSRLKDKRRLESHCLRGLEKIDLHCTLSVLTMNAMALSKIQAGRLDEIRFSTRKVV